MLRTPARRTTLAGLALLLGLCAGLGCTRQQIPAQGLAAQHYFPLVPGARWTYEIRSRLGKLEVEVVARGEMPVPGEELRVFVMDETNHGPSLGFVETAPVGYLVEHGFLARLASLDYDREGKLRLLGKQDLPAWFLPVDPRPGDHWNQESRLFSTPEGGGARLGWNGEVRSPTSLSVPAGTFSEVLPVHMEYHDPKDARPGPNVIYDDFYVRGVGLIRSVTSDPSGDPENNVEQVLLEYSFPPAGEPS